MRDFAKHYSNAPVAVPLAPGLRQCDKLPYCQGPEFVHDRAANSEPGEESL